MLIRITKITPKPEAGTKTMYYSMITAAALLFSLQFVFNEGYQRESGNGLGSALKFSLYTSAAGLILTLIINGFHIKLSLFSVAVALVYGVINILSIYSSIKAFDFANLSVYSLFKMIGGMLLPFVYGLMCGEGFRLTRIIGCALICSSMFMTVARGEGKGKREGIKYYVAVFLMNGMAGVISKFHQSNTEFCVDSASFLMLSYIITIVICAILLLRTKDFYVNKKSALYCAGHSAFNSIANLLLLYALLNLPASVQYPIVTGGTIVFATVIDKLRGRRVSGREFAAAGIALGSTVLMAL